MMCRPCDLISLTFWGKSCLSHMGHASSNCTIHLLRHGSMLHPKGVFVIMVGDNWDNTYTYIYIYTHFERWYHLYVRIWRCIWYICWEQSTSFSNVKDPLFVSSFDSSAADVTILSMKLLYHAPQMFRLEKNACLLSLFPMARDPGYCQFVRLTQSSRTVVTVVTL